MIRPDLDAIAAKWIAAFRLQNLRIDVGYVRGLVHPQNGQPVYALMSELNPDNGSYKIEVQDPDTWPLGADRLPTQRTIENAVRHEALHIRVRDFAKTNPSEGDIIAEERAVWAISDAFDLIADGEIPRIAAMIVPMLQRGPKHFNTAAAMVRAMAANTAGIRRQKTGKAIMDSLDLILAALTAALAAEDPKVAIESLISEIKRLKGASGDAAPPSAPEPGAPPMGADPGMDPSKDKMPDPNAMRAMAVDVAAFRKAQGEIKEALDIVRPAAKVELVRAMRADGIELTPAQEQKVLNAPDVPTAKTLVEGMRAMAVSGAKKKQEDPPANGANLTRAQRTTYEKLRTSSPANAEKYLAECVALNAAGKDGGK